MEYNTLLTGFVTYFKKEISYNRFGLEREDHHRSRDLDGYAIFFAEGQTKALLFNVIYLVNKTQNRLKFRVIE